MTDSVKIEIRIDRDFKKEASDRASALGLTLSDVVRGLLGFWLTCGAPDPTASDPNGFPTLQEIDASAQKMAWAALQVYRLLIQAQHNPAVFYKEGLKESWSIALPSATEDPPLDSPCPTPDGDEISNGDIIENDIIGGKRE